MKRIASFFLAVLMLISVPCTVFAEETMIEPYESSSVEYFSDGSYMVTEIETPGISLMSTSTITASKSTKYYSSKDVLQWTVKLTATFSYTGSSATCTKSSISHTIYNSKWKVKSATASRSGRTATGKYEIKYYFLGVPTATRSGTIKISCSNTGVIS